MNRRERIEAYFQGWIQRDDNCLDSLFSQDVCYYECYGPYYHGLDMLHKWFDDWQRFGTVLEWEIQDYIACGDQVVVTWYFHTIYEGEEDAFDGVSVMEFDEQDKIKVLKEYQSTLPHTEIRLK